LTLHAGVLVLLVGWPPRRPLAIPTPMQAVMVDMAPTAKAPPAPPTALPAGPQQHAQPRQRQVQHPRRPRQPPVMHAPSPDALSRVDPTQDTTAKPALQPSHEVDQTTAPPSVSAPSSTQLQAPRTTDATGQSPLITWQSLLLGHLAKYRRYPPRAERSRQQGIAYIRFTVDRKGDVLRAQLERSSGHALLDQEALATMQRASPVPPPPTAIPGDPVEVVVPVVFSLPKD